VGVGYGKNSWWNEECEQKSRGAEGTLWCVLAYMLGCIGYSDR
jgi:hypothetical protein